MLLISKPNSYCAGSGVVVAQIHPWGGPPPHRGCSDSHPRWWPSPDPKACTLGSGRNTPARPPSPGWRCSSCEICRHLAQLSFLIVVVSTDTASAQPWRRLPEEWPWRYRSFRRSRSRPGKDLSWSRCRRPPAISGFSFRSGVTPPGRREEADGLLQLHMDQVTFAHGHGTGGHLPSGIGRQTWRWKHKDVVAAVIDLHQNLARHVVVNHAGNGASRLGSLLLRKEDCPQGDQSDACRSRPDWHNQKSRQCRAQPQTQGLALKIIEEFRGRAGRRIIVADLPAVHSEIQQIRAVIVHGGHGNRRLIRTGGTSQADIRVFRPWTY